MNSPLLEKIVDTASRHPNRDALVCGEKRVSYRELWARIGSAASVLKSRGLRRGDRLILAAGNRQPAFVYGYFASQAVGAIAVPVDAAATSATLDAIKRQTRPRLVCMTREQFAEDAPPTRKLAAASLDQPVDILFTSGSSGRPKGVVQTYRNILAFAKARNAAVGCEAGDRLVLPLPLSHGFGLGRLRASMLAGATVILVDGFLFPGAIFEAFDVHGGASLCCVPAGFAALFRTSGDEIGRYRDRLRYVETATAPLPQAHRERLLRLLPRTPLFNSYGLTETTSSITFIDLQRASRKGQSSVGKPIAGVALKVVDAKGKRLPAGRIGEIRIRGASVMKKYWRDPARTRAVLAGGWYSSSDMGALDEAGTLSLMGRRDELINVGGLKVAPSEIESVLKEHPAVADCACVGDADAAGLLGEMVKVFMVPASGERPSAGELSAWLRGKIESYKIPSSFVWVARLPKTASGKVQHGLLR